jgi:hypothetical protein
MARVASVDVHTTVASRNFGASVLHYAGSWMQKLAQYLRMGPCGLAATVIIAVSVLFRTILVILHFPEINSDEGKMALAGMHIAFLGQFPIYDYGQDYLGVLEGYMGYALDGMVLFIPAHSG